MIGFAGAFYLLGRCVERFDHELMNRGIDPVDLWAVLVISVTLVVTTTAVGYIFAESLGIL